MHLPALATLSLFMGASLATVLDNQDIVERAIAAGPHPHGACGSQAGHACHGSEFGFCCSKSGQCGSSSSHCGSGCQGSYGHCRGHGGKPGGQPGGHGPPGKPGKPPGGPHIIVPLPKPTYSPYPHPSSIAYALSTNGRCGVNYRFYCNGSRWGDCCSEDSYCGSDETFCGLGCQSDFGNCGAVDPIDGSISSMSPSPTPSPSSSIASSSTIASTSSVDPSSLALPISRDGICGKTLGFTCKGSAFGACCGADGFCGLGAACGAGCQSDAGICAVISSSSSPSPSPTPTSSTLSSVVAPASNSLSSASAASASSASLASVSSASFASVSSVSIASQMSASSVSAASASSTSAVSAASASSASSASSGGSSGSVAMPIPSSNSTLLMVKRIPIAAAAKERVHVNAVRYTV